jgi:hypothetical protein
MKPLYAYDWHQCTVCGCTRPDVELRQLRLVDPVLKLEDDVFRCLDVALCARLDAGRREHLARDAAGFDTATPVRSRKVRP